MALPLARLELSELWQAIFGLSAFAQTDDRLREDGRQARLSGLAFLLPGKASWNASEGMGPLCMGPAMGS